MISLELNIYNPDICDIFSVFIINPSIESVSYWISNKEYKNRSNIDIIEIKKEHNVLINNQLVNNDQMVYVFLNQFLNIEVLSDDYFKVYTLSTQKRETLLNQCSLP